MTLLITVGTVAGIHQSSDYRLSDNGRPTETANGTKQLSVHGRDWQAHLSFTGIAKDGRGYETRAWLQGIATSTSAQSSLEAFVESVAAEASAAVSTVTSYDRRLTIVLGCLAAGTCRLFLISNWERLLQRPAATPSDAFHAIEVDMSRPRVMVNGLANSVPRSARRWLLRLVRANSHPRLLRSAVAAVNRLAAIPRGNSNFISPECWVQSLLSDGQSVGENKGAVPGSPSQIWLGGPDLARIVEEELKPIIGRRATIVQSAGFRGPGVPAPTDIGEPRQIHFSSPSASRRLSADDSGPALGSLTIDGQRGSIILRKNQWTSVIIGTITVEFDPTLVRQGRPFNRKFLRLPAPPIVDGAQPRAWDYPFDLAFDGTAYSLSIRVSSMAFRSSNHAAPLPVLRVDEELVMAAPGDTLVLSASAASPRSCGALTARFLLRDFPELGITRRPI